MVTFNTHIIDQTTKDKFHPFIAKAVEPMVPIHYEKIKLTNDHIVADVVVQQYAPMAWNNVSKRMLIVGKLVNGELKIVQTKQLNNLNYRAPIPCSDSNTNCYTEKNCNWSKQMTTPLAPRKMVHPKEAGRRIEDIGYQQRDYDQLRHYDPY